MNLQQIKKQLNEKAEEVFSKLGMECETFSDNIYSTCPVHEASDNPRAFSFSPQKGIWKCWTRDCQQEHGNDIFAIIKAVLSVKENKELEFKDALRWACDFLGVKITNSNKETSKQEIKEDDFSNIIKTIQRQYIKCQDKPITIDCNEDAPSEYFIGRGYKKSTVKYFGISDCENGIMKDRAVIPIHNDDGDHLVGIIGRSIKEYRSPKFLFYPTGFDKRYYFYNFHRAMKNIKNTSTLYILEGQGDVWRMYEAGVKNAISVFGKTITKEQQEKLLLLPITHLVIITDNDQAGREARVKIQRQLGRVFKLTFPRLENKDIGDMTVKNIKSKILNNLKGTY